MSARLALALFAIVACDQETIVEEPIIVPAPDWCDDAPVTTWANFGQGFLIENCQPCHATSSVDRHDAPETVYFDTPEDVLLRKSAILAMATGEDPLMPPAGGVSDEDRARLEAWLRCEFDPEL